jgi:anti-sigma regulatory factor (Ser/Thr protein kinase)
VEVIVRGSIRVAVEESSQVAEARRIARKMAVEIGFDEAAAERVSICVTEASTNLINHGGGGEVLLRITDLGAPELEMLALDRGPGMRDLDQCLRDGYSTGGTAGHGLGAIMRLSTSSDFYSLPAGGTAVLARWSAGVPAKHVPQETNRLRIGVVNLPKPGQEVCGDAWGAEQTEQDTVILLADGLGHGVDAQAASLEAARVLHSNPELAPMALIARSHDALRSFRGAAVAVARIDSVRGKLVFAGAGNVAAQIYAGAHLHQHLVSVNGTVGLRIPQLREFNYPWPSGGILILHSDGLATGTNLQTSAGLALRDPALIAGVLYRDFTRQNDDATVIVAKAS